MMKLFYNQNGIKPFRICAAILLIIAIIEIIMIYNTPTYEKELIQARQQYLIALKEYENDSYY